MKNSTCMSLAECWGEQWNDSAVAPVSPWLKTSLNRHLWDQTEVSVRLFLYNIILIIESFLRPTLWRWTSEHPASPVVCQDDQTASVFITNSLSSPSFPVTWEAKVEHVHWDIGQERGNWLETSVLKERSQPFWQKKNDWQWVFARLADMGTQRLVSGEGQNGKRHARIGTTNKVIQTVSLLKL